MQDTISNNTLAFQNGSHTSPPGDYVPVERIDEPLTPVIVRNAADSPIATTEIVTPEMITLAPHPLIGEMITAEIVAAEIVTPELVPTPLAAARTHLLVRIWKGVKSLIEWCFGVVSLIAGLALLAAIPVAGLLSLGYLLEASGRIARTGRFRAGFIGVRKAARVGGFVLGVWAVLLPLRLTFGIAMAGRSIDPSSPATRIWSIAHTVLSLIIGAHILIACARGGKLRHFLLPFPSLGLLKKLDRQLMAILGGKGRPVGRICNPATGEIEGAGPDYKSGLQESPTGWGAEPLLLTVIATWCRHPWKNLAKCYIATRDDVWNFAVSLRLPYFFWLGLRGMLGGLAWLALPVTMVIVGLAGTPRFPVLGLLVFIGEVSLVIVVMYLPFLQTRFACENRLRAMFEVRAVRQHFARAPVAFTIGLWCSLLFALPLYLLKIEFVPREIAWLPSLFFVMFIFPARLLTGWAYARARRRETPRHWFFRWPSRLSLLPVATFYVLMLNVTAPIVWSGYASLYHQHAFLVPVPFLDM